MGEIAHSHTHKENAFSFLPKSEGVDYDISLWESGVSRLSWRRWKRGRERERERERERDDDSFLLRRILVSEVAGRMMKRCNVQWIFYLGEGKKKGEGQNKARAEQKLIFAAAAPS